MMILIDTVYLLRTPRTRSARSAVDPAMDRVTPRSWPARIFRGDFTEIMGNELWFLLDFTTAIMCF